MRITPPVPARFLLATLCCLSLQQIAEADTARPTPPAAEPSAAGAEAPSTRGHAAYDAGQYAEAVRHYDEAYRLDPNDFSILMLRGGANARLGRCKEAIADFDAFEDSVIVSDSMVYAEVYLDRAYCQMQLKDYVAAARDLEDQVHYKPDDDWAWATLGRAYGLLKRYEESEEALKRAIKLNPDDPYAHYQLGLVYMVSGRSRDAIPYLQTTVRLEPGNKEARELLDTAVAETSGKPATAAGSPAAAPSSGAQPTQAPTSQSRTPVAGSAAPITIIDGMAIGREGVRSSLVRISAPGSAPSVFYVDEASRRQAGQKDIVAIWVLQVWPNGNPSVAKVSAVWTEIISNCKLNSYEITRGILLDRQAKVLSDDAMNARGTSAKDPTKETPFTIACKTVTPSKGPRFASATAAIADAISGAPQSTPNAAAAQAPTATPAAKPASGACKVARVQVGVDTVASVERDILARGGSPLTGGSGPAKYRVSTMSGDYQDAGTDVMAVNYDFDAAGPAGRLVAVTIVNQANTGPGYENLLASRKAAAAAIAGPLQQKSATELVASGPGCQLRLLPNADTWFIYEVYQLPN